ncbi:MAG: spore germination protein, partial [Clostridiales bacterium]|nr:spore germination protein [Clostridiales bacterium]
GIPKGTKIRKSLQDNIIYVRNRMGNSFDLLVREVELDGKRAVFFACEELCDALLMSQSVVKPILENGRFVSGSADVIEDICEPVTRGLEHKDRTDIDDAIKDILTGYIVFMVDGVQSCRSYGVQKIPTRSVTDPDAEVQERGSREGFVENFKINLALIRKRLCTDELKVEMTELGVTSHTRVCICTMEGRADSEMVQRIKSDLQSAELDVVLGAGYIQEFIDKKKKSMFTSVGVTERPDVFCAKICEGRVGIIVDGTPFALILPYLFIENFHTMDDYLSRTYYVAMMRILRVVSFLISTLLPGIYVAIGLFHQELLPDDMLVDIVTAESNTMFPLMMEALIIHFIYEIVREAGLRMPKSVGHAVSIVGALVIGDAAVSAGLIGAPMLIVIALTAICSSVVSSLHHPIAVLRFIFIIAGGVSGLYGIMIGLGLLIINLCSLDNYGIPYMAPFSPFEAGAMRDTLVRVGWKKLGRNIMEVGKIRELRAGTGGHNK